MRIHGLFIYAFLLVCSSSYAAEFETGIAQQLPSDEPLFSSAHQPVMHSPRLTEQTVYFSVKYPGVEDDSGFALISGRHHHHHNSPHWVSMSAGDPLPAYAVIGGSQPHPYAILYVCRANYRGGMHPGKWYQGNCNIGWGGEEISLSHYQVLASRRPLTWVPTSFGRLPVNAIQGGYQHDGPLYICQGFLHGGMHVGKVYGQNCNIGWGGREELLTRYNVLVG